MHSTKVGIKLFESLITAGKTYVQNILENDYIINYLKCLLRIKKTLTNVIIDYFKIDAYISLELFISET